MRVRRHREGQRHGDDLATESRSHRDSLIEQTSHDRPAQPAGAPLRGVVRRGVSQNEAFDPIFQQTRVEVDQQPDELLSQPKIGEELGFEDRNWSLEALDLDDDQIFYHEVHMVVAEQVALVTSRDAFLTLVAQADLVEFDAHGRLVETFQQARPQYSMDRNRAADDA